MVELLNLRKNLKLRMFLRKAIVTFKYYSGLYLIFHDNRKTRTLLYHQISDNSLSPYSVSPVDFEKQVAYLAQNYKVISLDKLLGYIRAKQKVPNNAVVITIDDGYQDNYTFAYPILKKYSIPATIFVCTEFIQKKHTSSEYSKYLSWEQIVEMSSNGISFGSHTMNHIRLTEIPLGKANKEISESKKILEKHLNMSVNHFAYPGGCMKWFNAHIKKIVAESGYLSACTGCNGTNGINTDPYQLRRTKIEAGDGIYVFEKALKGALDILIIKDQFNRF